MDKDEFVLMHEMNEDGTEQFIGGGFSIQSLTNDINTASMQTINDMNTEQKGGKVSNIFENLAIPSGLYCANANAKTTNKYLDTFTTNNEMISDDLFDKLFGMMQYTNGKTTNAYNTRKKINNKKTNRKNTRKKV